MWNAAAAVDGVKRGVPSASSPAFSGCCASTSFSRGSARSTSDSGRCGGSGRSTRMPVTRGVAVELVEQREHARERRVARQPLRAREHPGLVRVAVDPALVDLRRVVLADQQRGDPDLAVERVDAVLDLLHQLGRVPRPSMMRWSRSPWLARSMATVHTRPLRRLYEFVYDRRRCPSF